ncbi:hypothetical protein [Ectopseudomonas mendocina]|uniref:hypothetical protein n=1 Tax=Ectopseudomonas mendocina TaxID=300 RepID=UPI003F05C7CD
MSHVGILNAHSGQMKATSMFVMTSLLMAINGAADAATTEASPKERCAVVQHENAKTIADFIHLASTLSAALDESYNLILSHKGISDDLLDHPFATIASIMDTAVKRLLPLKRKGELSPEESLYLRILAEARQKSNRNAHLIRQMTADPTVFTSSIDRSGLVALSTNANQARTALRS